MNADIGQGIAIITLRSGETRLAGDLTDAERNQIMLDAAAKDRNTMRLHLKCNVHCPINKAVLAERRSF